MYNDIKEAQDNIESQSLFYRNLFCNSSTFDYDNITGMCLNPYFTGISFAMAKNGIL